MPEPAASTPNMATPASSTNGANRPAALEPPPTHATSASGRRPVAVWIWFLTSCPITAWKSRTITGYGCGPATEPMR